MKVAFVTTQSPQGSTVVGRVLPLAEELSKAHKVHVLVHNFSPPYEGGVPRSERGVGVAIHEVGADPFIRTFQGKKRLRGVALITRLKLNIILSAFMLVRLKPDVIIIVKSLPENVLAARLATFFFRSEKIILDVDDFELTANQLTSWTQRAAIHWAERVGSRLAHHIVAATPFLADHFEQLTQGKKKVTMIPTGLSVANGPPAEALAKEGPQALIYAGSLSLSSGHRIDLLPDILAEVRREYPKIELQIYGTGDDEKKLKEMFSQKNLTDAVIWYGRFVLHSRSVTGGYSPGVAERGSEPATTPGESASLTLAREIARQGILLDPIDNSITARAKSSFRVALAAALGAPVVTSDIGIRPYLLPDGLHARCFAKPADATDYAAKVIDFIRRPLSPEDQRTMRMHGEQHSWLRLAQEYEKIIAA